MQNPTRKTTIPRCLHLATYSARMLGKLPNDTVLAECATKMGGAGAVLKAANDAYEQSKVTVVEARVDMKFTEVTNDAELQNMARRIEIADNKAGGPLLKLVAPEGKAALTRPQGETQHAILKDVIAVLTNLVSVWPGAAQELVTVGALEQAYDTALKGRKAAWQNARNLRVARNLAKEAFLKAYLEVSFTVKAHFPMDKKMQDLFFDDVENDVEKDLGDDDPPQDGDPPQGDPPQGDPPQGDPPQGDPPQGDPPT